MKSRVGLAAMLAAGLLAASPAGAQPAPQSSPPRREAPPATWSGPLGQWRASLVPMLMRDFGERYLYAAADRALPPPDPRNPRVVFLGDSITDLWDLARAFPGRDYVNRGIGGQVTAQMVLRVHPDVLALKPAAVFILGGINDLPGVLQAPSNGAIEANWQAMAEMARTHGVRVVFASLTPLNAYTDNARTLLQERPPARIAALNRWLARYAQACGLGFADLRPALSDPAGMLRREFTHDGLHPDAAGYAAMAPVVQAALARALAASPPPGGLSPACAAVTPDS